MTAPWRAPRKSLIGGAVLAAACLAACDQPVPRNGATADRPPAEELATLPPPIAPPTEHADPDEPPSYEVGIATAAAERNRAKKKCAELPEGDVRAACETDADVAFEAASRDLETLRVNQ
jgi:hypothetical protein